MIAHAAITFSVICYNAGAKETATSPPFRNHNKGLNIVIRHVVVFQKKPETDETTVQEIMMRLEALVGEIPGLTELRCTRSIASERPVVWTFLLDSFLESEEALKAYGEHPAHVEVNDWMSPFLENRAVIDYLV